MITPNLNMISSEATHELSNLEKLPIELIINIMLKMDIHDILKIGSTSRTLRAQANSNLLWVELIKRDFGQSEVDAYLKQQNLVFGKSRAKDYYRFLIEKKTMPSYLLNEVNTFSHDFLYFLNRFLFIKDDKDFPSDAVKALEAWLILTDDEKIAALDNTLTQVETLVSFLASSKLKSSNGETLLYLAVIYNHTVLATALLKKNDININQQGSFGNTILCVAASNGKTAVVSALLARNDIAVNMPNTNGNTPLHLAIMNRHTDVVNALIHHKNNHINQKNENGDTPLHLAVKHGHTDILQKLLACKEIDLNITNKDGNTALKDALRYLNIRVATLIIEHRLKSSKHVLLGQGIGICITIATGLILFLGFHIPVAFSVIGSLVSGVTSFALVRGIQDYQKNQENMQTLNIQPYEPAPLALKVLNAREDTAASVPKATATSTPKPVPAFQ